MASAGDRLGVDCPGGRKKVAQHQAQLPLVLGVPAISSCISPMTVNIRVYVAYRNGSNFGNTSTCVNLTNSIKYMGDSRSYLSYRHSHYALLILTIRTPKLTLG